MKTIRLISLLALGLCGSASISQAALVYGLTSNNRIVSFDSATPGVLISDVAISGAASLVDLDIYPVNGLIYAMQGNGNTFSINAATGVATSLFAASNQPSAGGFAVRDFDFNPAADRIRISGDVTGNNDFNARMVPNVVTGGGPGPNPGGFLVDGDGGDTTGGDGTYTGAIPASTLNIVGNAYTNSFDGTATTTLYSLDTGSDSLLTHGTAPQFNAYTAVLLTGATLGSNVGFDIDFGTNAFVSDDSLFYTLNLATGALASVGTIGSVTGIIGGGTVLSIAVVPEPSRALLGLAGLVLIGLRRRRA